MSADRTGQLSPDQDPEIRLVQLPSLEPPRDVLPSILEEIRRRPREVQRRRSHRIAWASAAVLVLSLGVISLLTQRVDRQSQELADWVQYSQQLESQLRSIDGGGQVMRGHRAAVMGELEDQIAMIDWQLGGRPPNAEQIALWQQRAVLLNDLVTVHAGDLVLSEDQARRPVVTINPPMTITASYEL